MRMNVIKIGFFSLLSFTSISSLAARPVDLSKQSVEFLQSFAAKPTLARGHAPASDLKELSQAVDFKQTLHVRLQQTYAGYPVWGGEAIMHIPHTQPQKNQSLMGLVGSAGKTSTMNGVVYEDLDKDLKTAPAHIFTTAQADKALAQAIELYQKEQQKTVNLENKHVELMSYIDDANKAHWAFYVRFYATTPNARPAIPVYILDADNLQAYETWNDIKTLDNVEGGGFGGNTKMGKQTYDGLSGNLPQLAIQRDTASQLCYLKNNDVTVADYRKGENTIVSFTCGKTDAEHNQVYWDGESDQINGGFSPNHDALYAGNVISGMYQSWYQIPALTNTKGKPMVLFMVTHSPNMDERGNSDPDNAYWDPDKQKMYFGDGQDYFYPLTSLGVAAHEISHGFTQQHANLQYVSQSGGMNEAFSDMAAQAAEFYSLNKNTWEIGAEITKTKDLPVLRYMQNPSDDCKFSANAVPGEDCSLQRMSDYDAYVAKHKKDKPAYRYPNVHLSSGIYNRAFYLMGTAPGWDAKKAFNVMVQANRYYWTKTSTFAQGACGVMKATKDYQYETTPIAKAFAEVGIDVGSC